MFAKIANAIHNLFRVRSSKTIFAYHDGAKWRSADPIEVLMKIENHPTYLDSKHHPLAAAGDPEAMQITADAVCDFFGVQAYSDLGGKPRGLPISQRIALLDAFYDYCNWVKKNIEPGPTPVLSTESTLAKSSEAITSDS